MSMEQQEKREETANAKKSGGKRRFRYGGLAIVLSIVVVAVAVLLNMGVTALDENWGLRVDVSAAKTYKLSPQTENAIKNLSEPIQFIALYEEGQTNIYTGVDVMELLGRYRRLNVEKITVTQIDPVRNPAAASKFSTDGAAIEAGSVIVASADSSRYRVIAPRDMFEMDFDPQTYQQYPKAFNGEQALTNAAVFVTMENQQKIFFMSGHGEVPVAQYAPIQNQLKMMNLVVESVDPLSLDKLSPGDILVINAPQSDLSDQEREGLKVYLEKGGMMIYMRSFLTEALPNMESLMTLHGVTVRHDMVIENDASMSYQGEPLMLVPALGAGDVVKPLKDNNLVPILYAASSFDISAVEEYGRTITPLLSTSANSFGRDLDANKESASVQMVEGDLPGPRTVAVAVEQENSNAPITKIVAIGNSDFISVAQWASWPGNTELFYNTVRWMQGDDQAVSILGKSLLGNRLSVTSTTQMYALMAVVVIVIPLIILGFGVAVWLRRRHL